ncbi:MAG: hypothetical protein GXO21_01640, partial [Aquificae bacterium]|nr:hypothetical protein [Aquificota bacterium]
YINLNNILAIELQEPTTDLYDEVYKWAFYTISPHNNVFYSQVFNSREEAIAWFEEVLGEYVGKKV